MGLVAGVVALAAVVVVVRRGDRPGPAPTGTATVATTTATTAPAAPTTAVGAPQGGAPEAGGLPPSPAAAAASSAPGALAVALASPDPFVRRKAVEDAVTAKDVGALAQLYGVDLAANGYVAAAAIDGVGKLAALLPVAERKEPIRVLDKWLRAESVRDAKEALGNATIAVEALGDTKSKDAVQPLMDALDGARVPLALQTRIVEVLGELDDPRAAPAVQRFLARVEAEAQRLGDGGTSLEQELVKEARAAGQAVLAKWKV